MRCLRVFFAIIFQTNSEATWPKIEICLEGPHKFDWQSAWHHLWDFIHNGHSRLVFSDWSLGGPKILVRNFFPGLPNLANIFVLLAKFLNLVVVFAIWNLLLLSENFQNIRSSLSTVRRPLNWNFIENLVLVRPIVICGCRKKHIFLKNLRTV